MNGISEIHVLSTGLKTGAMLCVVLGLLVLSLYLMKRFLFFKKGREGDMMIRVLSSLHLSPKERIQVVEIAGVKIVLGVTPGGISFLTRLHDTGENGENHHGNQQ